MSTLLVRALSRFKIQPLGGVFDLSTVELGNIAARLCESSFASGSHSVKTVCKCAQRLEARRKRAISEILTPDKRGPCLSALKRLKFQPPNGDCLSVSTSDDRHELTAIEKGADTLWPSCVPFGSSKSSRTFFFCPDDEAPVPTPSVAYHAPEQGRSEKGSPWKPPNREALNYSQIPIKQGFTQFSPPPSSLSVLSLSHTLSSVHLDTLQREESVLEHARNDHAKRKSNMPAR